MLRVRGVHKAVAAHFVIDESTAMTIARDDTAHDGRAARLAFWLTGLTIFVWWNIMTFVGAAGATALGNPEDFGLDRRLARRSWRWYGRSCACAADGWSRARPRRSRCCSRLG